MGHASTAVGELYTSPLLRLRALGFMGGYKKLEAPLFFGGDQTNNTWLVATQIVFIFAPILGKRNPFWRAYFSKGLEPPTSFSRNLKNTKNKNIWRPKDGIKHDSVCFLSVKIFFVEIFEVKPASLKRHFPELPRWKLTWLAGKPTVNEDVFSIDNGDSRFSCYVFRRQTLAGFKGMLGGKVGWKLFFWTIFPQQKTSFQLQTRDPSQDHGWSTYPPQRV